MENEEKIIDDIIDEVMENCVEEVDKLIEEDEELKKEADELFSTEDIQERIKIYKKYHPDDDLGILD